MESLEITLYDAFPQTVNVLNKQGGIYLEGAAKRSGFGMKRSNGAIFLLLCGKVYGKLNASTTNNKKAPRLTTERLLNKRHPQRY